MDDQFKRMARCFNLALLGWKYPERRQYYHRQIQQEDKFIGEKVAETFIRVMESDENPSDYLSAYFQLMKEMQTCRTKTKYFSDEQWKMFIAKAQNAFNSFSNKKENSAVLDIPLAIFRMYHLQEEAQTA